MTLKTKNSKLILTVLAMMMSVAAFAQNITVTGTEMTMTPEGASEIYTYTKK